MQFSVASSSPRLIAAPKPPKCASLRPIHPAQPRENSIAQKTAGALLGGLLGAALVTAIPVAFTPPAEAGVVITQPQRKSVFYGTEDTKKDKTKKAAAASSSQGSFALPNFGDAGVLALPVSVVGIVGLAAVGSQLDSGLGGFLQSTIIKDNNAEGAGYEIELQTIGDSKKK